MKKELQASCDCRLRWSLVCHSWVYQKQLSFAAFKLLQDCGRHRKVLGVWAKKGRSWRYGVGVIALIGMLWKICGLWNVEGGLQGSCNYIIWIMYREKGSVFLKQSFWFFVFPIYIFTKRNFSSMIFMTLMTFYSQMLLCELLSPLQFLWLCYFILHKAFDYLREAQSSRNW